MLPALRSWPLISYRFLMGSLRNKAACNVSQLFGESGYRPATANIFVHFPEPLYDIGIGGYQGTGTLRIFSHRFSHRIFNGAYACTVKLCVNINADNGDLAENNGGCSPYMRDLRSQSGQPIGGRLCVLRLRRFWCCLFHALYFRFSLGLGFGRRIRATSGKHEDGKQ
jgi:hypothetical protein